MKDHDIRGDRKPGWGDYSHGALEPAGKSVEGGVRVIGELKRNKCNNHSDQQRLVPTGDCHIARHSDTGISGTCQW